MPTKIFFSIIFLPMILLIGFTSTYSDFLASKIKNKWVLLGLSYAFAVYMVSWILYFLTLKNIFPPSFQTLTNHLIWNFDKWCVNLVISIIVAYLLWRYKMWGAGDAKLFICFSSLIPMGQYSKVYFKYYFASFFLLLMIFIPATIYLFLKSCVYFMKRLDLSVAFKEMPKSAKEKLIEFIKLKRVKIFLGFFVFFLFFRLFSEVFSNLIGRFLSNQKILVVISVLMFRPLSKIFRKNAKFIFVIFILLILYMIYTRGQFFSRIVNTFWGAAIVILIFPIFKKIIDLYSERTIHKTTPFAFWIFLGALLTWFWQC